MSWQVTAAGWRRLTQAGREAASVSKHSRKGCVQNSVTSPYALNPDSQARPRFPSPTTKKPNRNPSKLTKYAA